MKFLEPFGAGGSAMSRTALFCSVAVVLAITAGTAPGQVLGVVPVPGQESWHWKDTVKTAPTYPLLEQLAKQHSVQESLVKDLVYRPQSQDQINGLPPQGKFPGIKTAPTTPPLTVVDGSEGGLISEYNFYWQRISALNGPVKIMGMCQSACTMVMAHIPKDRLCFGDAGHLKFHQARVSQGGPIAPDSTQWMINQYPDDVRSWIVAHGGLQGMPSHGYWTLTASELWQMGYKRCSN